MKAYPCKRFGVRCSALKSLLSFISKLVVFQAIESRDKLLSEHSSVEILC